MARDYEDLTEDQKYLAHRYSDFTCDLLNAGFDPADLAIVLRRQAEGLQSDIEEGYFAVA